MALNWDSWSDLDSKQMSNLCFFPSEIKRKDDSEKVWLSFGNLFIKTKVQKAKEIITKGREFNFWGTIKFGIKN